MAKMSAKMKPGMHKMPDGKMMKDSDMKKKKAAKKSSVKKRAVNPNGPYN